MSLTAGELARPLLPSFVRRRPRRPVLPDRPSRPRLLALHDQFSSYVIVMDALAAEIARLRAELAREKDGRARAEAEKDSLARLATSSLIRLGLNISEPVGIWIREDEQQRLEYLLEASEVDRMLASEGTWTRTMVSSTASLRPSLPSSRV